MPLRLRPEVRPGLLGNYLDRPPFDTRNADGTLGAILSRLRSSCVDAGVVDGELWCVDASAVRARIPRGPRTEPRGVPEAAS